MLTTATSTAPAPVTNIQQLRHPAKYSHGLIELFAMLCNGYRRILDPFAGTGRIHDLADYGDYETTGLEIEPEWAAMHPRTVEGNALRMPFADNTFDCVVTSPTYGNRMADHYVARDNSVRHTYRQALRRDLHPDNSGRLQWGQRYRDFHVQAWAETQRVLSPRGLLVLNLRDHIRGGELQPVTGWHTTHLIDTGFTLLNVIAHSAPSLRYGANHKTRAGDGEIVFVFQNR